MSEQDLRKMAAECFAAYKDGMFPEGGTQQMCFEDGFLAGASAMAEYIGNAIKFMAENNPKL